SRDRVPIDEHSPHKVESRAYRHRNVRLDPGIEDLPGQSLMRPTRAPSIRTTGNEAENAMKAERSAAHQEGPLGAHADRRSARYRRLSRAVLSIAVACLLPGIALAQVPPGAPAGAAPPAPAMSAAELETLVAPVALYPDDLLGILLPAATTPL